MFHRIDLSGDAASSPWRARFSDYERGKPEYANRDVVDDARYYPVTVPGEIHLDLMRLGMIPDVYRNAQALAARWVEEQIWSYRREFGAPTEAREPGMRAWLHFEGLDYAAEIMLNGEKIGEHANFFRPCRIEVTGKLREAANVLTVHLDGGLYHVADKRVDGYNHSKSPILTKRQWLRKPQCQFGWDWSTRLINVGIHGRVWLEFTSDELRTEQLVPLATLSDDLQTGSLTARVFAANLSTHEIPATLQVEIVEAEIKVSEKVTLKPGSHSVETTTTIPSPKLWWPRGRGPQTQYTVRASLVTANGTYALPEKRVGFRHVRVNQNTHPVSGSYFILEINGQPIFCKGGNYVPADMIFSAIDNPRVTKLVELAIEQNFNFLRVWGGGLYESDHFFDLCNREGILVWQEFIYACAKYPHTEEWFHREAEREAVHQIRRLAHNPSLVIWCGNNENETAHWNWGTMDRGVIGPDYMFYHLTLPRLMAKEDPTRYYHPSSPLSPNQKNPNDDDSGDQHPWSIGMWDTDFRKYRQMICRFPNEGGILGPTSLPTMHACLPEGQKFVQSFAWQVHDNSVDSWAEPSPIDTMTDFHLGRSNRTMSIEEYTYWGGLLQGEGLREYVDNFRRRMFDSASAIFWMYNDCWPCTRSWTTVDFHLNRTPSFHPVRRAFEPVRVIVVEGETTVDIYGVNDTLNEVRGEVRFGLFTVTGKYFVDKKAPAALAPNARTLLATFEKSAWKNPAQEVAFAQLSVNGKTLSRNRLLLPLLKDMHWPKPTIHVRIENGHALFTADTFVVGVCIDLNGGETPDNFFDLFPATEHRIPWKSPIPPKILYTANLLRGA